MALTATKFHTDRSAEHARSKCFHRLGRQASGCTIHDTRVGPQPRTDTTAGVQAIVIRLAQTGQLVYRAVLPNAFRFS